jgi:hypothetical protein
MMKTLKAAGTVCTWAVASMFGDIQATPRAVFVSSHSDVIEGMNRWNEESSSYAMYIKPLLNYGWMNNIVPLAVGGERPTRYVNQGATPHPAFKYDPRMPFGILRPKLTNPHGLYLWLKSRTFDPAPDPRDFIPGLPPFSGDLSFMGMRKPSMARDSFHAERGPCDCGVPFCGGPGDIVSVTLSVVTSDPAEVDVNYWGEPR